MSTDTCTTTGGPEVPAMGEQSLMKNTDFLKVWTGETVSVLGNQVTQLALPLVAILTLQASAFDIGLMNASRYLPVVVVSLLAGVWLDRRRRRPVLIASNLGRAVLIGIIPVAAAFGLLSIWLLCALCIAIGTLTVFFDVGLLSYFPGLVERRHLAEGNGKLQTSWSLAGIVGPGAAGLLVGVIGAPVTLMVDAASFVVSALFLIAVRKLEPEPDPNHVHLPLPGPARARLLPVASRTYTPGSPQQPWPRRHERVAENPLRVRSEVRASIIEGLSSVFGSPLLRSLLAQSATFNLIQNAMTTVFLVYAVRVLLLSPVHVGVVTGSMSVGALAGAILCRRITTTIGLGRTLRHATIAVGLAPTLLAIPSGPDFGSMAILIASQAIIGFNLVVYNVNTVTLRQTITPNRLLARMNASYRLVLFGTVPIGAVLGGILAEVAGLRTAMIVVVIVMTTPIIWTFFSPVFSLREMPACVDDITVSNPPVHKKQEAMRATSDRLIGYACFRTTDRNTEDGQRNALTTAGCDWVFTDTVSGKHARQPQLDALLNYARAGDVIVITKFDRLGRSVAHLAEVASQLLGRGVHLRVLHQGIDTTTPEGRLTFHILASVAELERNAT